jgi:hypothetical protein
MLSETSAGAADVKVQMPAAAAAAQPVMATAVPAGMGAGAAPHAVPPAMQQPQVVYVQAPPMIAGTVMANGACACGGAGTLVSQQISSCQLIAFSEQAARRLGGSCTAH